MGRDPAAAARGAYVALLGQGLVVRGVRERERVVPGFWGGKGEWKRLKTKKKKKGLAFLCFLAFRSHLDKCTPSLNPTSSSCSLPFQPPQTWGKLIREGTEIERWRRAKGGSKRSTGAVFPSFRKRESRSKAKQREKEMVFSAARFIASNSARTAFPELSYARAHYDEDDASMQQLQCREKETRGGRDRKKRVVDAYFVLPVSPLSLSSSLSLSLYFLLLTNSNSNDDSLWRPPARASRAGR